MTRVRKRALLDGVFGFVVFCTFFSVITALFVEPTEIKLGPMRCSRQIVAVLFIYGLGLVVARIEYRRTLAESESPSSRSPRDKPG